MITEFFSSIGYGIWYIFYSIFFCISQVSQFVWYLLTLIVPIILKSVESLIFYSFVALMLLVPQLIVLGILAYRTKPDEESFKKYVDNLFRISEIQTRSPQVSQSDKTEDTQEKVKTLVRRSSQRGNFIQRKLDEYSNQFMIWLVKNRVAASTIHYDCGIFRFAMMHIEGQSQKFIGIFGTWVPV